MVENMEVGYWVFGIVIRVEFIYSVYFLLFILGIDDGKLKMSFKFGEYGVIIIGGFNLIFLMFVIFYL